MPLPPSTPSPPADLAADADAAPTPTPAPGPGGNARSATKAAGVVGLAVMCSRILGLIRDLLIAHLFGAGKFLDAFLTAFRTPNLLRDLFAEGALSTAFVTVFTKEMTTNGDASAWRLASKVATLTVVAMSAITLVGIAIAPVLVTVLAPGFHAVPGKVELTVLLVRIMYPFILLVSLAALVMGMLNARQIFGVPALASSFFNIGSIVGGIGLGWWLDPAFGQRALVGLAIGTLIGGFLQLAVQLPTLWKAGFRFTPDFAWRQDAGVRKVLSLMGPAIIAGSAVQVNVLINSVFASMQDGAIGWLNYAFRLMQLPLGVFGVAIATVTLPLVSRSAALGDEGEFRGILARALRLGFFLTVPSAVGLICLAQPIISLIFQHGKFDANATVQTAAALQFYALGLVGYAGVKVLAPAFYALDLRKTPMNVSFLAIAANVALNATFTFALGWGHRGLALSTSLTAMMNFGLLYALMRRRVGRLETGEMVRTLARLAIAGLVLAAVCWAGERYVLAGVGGMRTWEKAARLLAVIGAAGGAFFAACYALRVSEMREATDIVARRLKRGGRGRR